jgi:hypothetical protein
MAKVVLHPKADDPQAMYPGVADVNREGVSIAIDMLYELEGGNEDADGVGPADRSSLDNWPRQGLLFRNIVAEYLAQARRAGPDVEAGFCAVLCDIVALNCQGLSSDGVARYEPMYNL